MFPNRLIYCSLKFKKTTKTDVQVCENVNMTVQNRHHRLHYYANFLLSLRHSQTDSVAP